ncbi:MAG: hypothetical protein UW70_C0085G0005 [Candidatus Peregrinibacteria bacterium GW2011_GWA2_44_7]|nr:MAG: hypothetical protein UW70_C0085G0005 [Candidatus Peregrinibacteria bacterium GW2011_GWA2_44_7]
MADDSSAPPVNSSTGDAAAPKKRNRSSQAADSNAMSGSTSGSQGAVASDQKPRKRRRRRPRKPTNPKSVSPAIADLSVVESDVVDQLQQPSASVVEREADALSSQVDPPVQTPADIPYTPEFQPASPPSTPKVYPTPSVSDAFEDPSPPVAPYVPEFQPPVESVPAVASGQDSSAAGYTPEFQSPSEAPVFQSPAPSEEVPVTALMESSAQEPSSTGSDSVPHDFSDDTDPFSPGSSPPPAYDLSYSLDDKSDEDSSVADYSSPIASSEPEGADFSPESDSFSPSSFDPSSPFQPPSDVSDHEEISSVPEEDVSPPGWSEPEPEPEPERFEEQILPSNENQSDTFEAPPSSYVEEPIEAEVVETSPPPLADSAESSPRHARPSLDALGGVKVGFYDRLIDLLHEANLTPRHLQFCCAGLLVFFIIIGIGFFIVPSLLEKGLPFGSDTQSTETETPEPESEPAAELIFKGSSGVDVALLMGYQEQNPDPTSKFQGYVKDLNRIYTLYYVDITGLLAAPGSRTATLDNYIGDFKAAYNDGVIFYREIQAIRTAFSTQFEKNVPPKEAAEVGFFEDVKAFKGGSAERQLVQFIALNQKQAELRAKYLAFGRLEQMYKVVLESSQHRLKDLELNREALLAGVQVVDVYGSDLDLILKETDLE